MALNNLQRQIFFKYFCLAAKREFERSCLGRSSKSSELLKNKNSLNGLHVIKQEKSRELGCFCRVDRRGAAAAACVALHAGVRRDAKLQC
jgi:hypothetical protein